MDSDYFGKAVDEFMEPVASFLQYRKPRCVVTRVHPNEREEDDILSLAQDEAEHYLRTFLGEGFFAAVRGLQLHGQHKLEIVLWEEPDAKFRGPYWPELEGEIEFNQIWRGFHGQQG